MKCSGCEIQIPPKWIHCINSNICPQCGGAIYSEEQKILLEELREALSKMDNISAEGVVGWLLSNYTLKKIGEYEPEFHQPPIQPQIQQPTKVAGNMKGFYERASIAKELEGRKNLKVIAEALRNGDVDEQYGTSIGTDGDINVDEEADISTPEYFNSASNSPQFLAKELLANNAPMPSDAKPLSPEETAAVVNAIKGAEEESAARTEVSLNRQRLNRLAKQRELIEIGSVGRIKRR